MNWKEAAERCLRYGIKKYNFFIGAGMSIGSGLPSWKDLVKPYAQNLGIDVADVPLERIMQYAIGKDTSAYSMFIHDFLADLDVTLPSLSHELIAQLPVTRVWTTNYDDLLEKAFSKHNIDVEVISNDHELINSDFLKKQIIKMHGSITHQNHEHHDEIILTESQYELFDKNRPRIASQLMVDVTNKGFIFLGVSFNDSNMRRIWATLWANRHAGLPSFLLTMPPEPSSVKERKLYELWKSDLSRYNITVVELDSFREIQEFLQWLYVRSAGKTIALIGSSDTNTLSPLCYHLGEKLGESDFFIHSGGGKTIADSVAAGFWEKVAFNLNNVNRVVYHFRVGGGTTNPRHGQVIYWGSNYSEMRKALFTGEKLCILVGDGTRIAGMEEEVSIARGNGCRILAVAKACDYTQQIYEEETSSWKSIFTDVEFEAYQRLDTAFLGEESNYAENMMVVINGYFRHFWGVH